MSACHSDSAPKLLLCLCPYRWEARFLQTDVPNLPREPSTSAATRRSDVNGRQRRRPKSQVPHGTVVPWLLPQGPCGFCLLCAVDGAGFAVRVCEVTMGSHSAAACPLNPAVMICLPLVVFTVTTGIRTVGGRGTCLQHQPVYALIATYVGGIVRRVKNDLF